MERENKNLTIRVTPGEYEKIKCVADAHTRPMANLIKMITMKFIDDYLDNQARSKEQGH